MNSTRSPSDPQAALIKDAAASDEEGSIWVFPQCRYNSITSKSVEFLPRRLCPHKSAGSNLKTMSSQKKALGNDEKPSAAQVGPRQNMDAEKGASSKNNIVTENPPAKKQKVAVAVHPFLSKDGSTPFLRTGRSAPTDTKVAADTVDNYRYERMVVRGKFQEVIVLSDSDEYVSEDSDRDSKTGTKVEKGEDPNVDLYAAADTVNEKDANDENDDFCHVCGFGGSLYMCDGCCNSVHFKCLAEDVQEDIKALMKELKKKHKNDKFNDSFNDMPFYCNECENGFINDEDDAQVEKDTELFHEGGILRKFRNMITQKDGDGAVKTGHVEAGWKALILGEDEEYDRVTKEITENMKDGKFDSTLYPNGGFEQRNLRQRERQVFDHYFEIKKNLKNDKRNKTLQTTPKNDKVEDTKKEKRQINFHPDNVADTQNKKSPIRPQPDNVAYAQKKNSPVSPRPDEVADAHSKKAPESLQPDEVVQKGGASNTKPKPPADKLANCARVDIATAAAAQNTSDKIVQNVDVGCIGDEFAPLDLTGEEEPKFQPGYEDDSQYDESFNEIEDLHTNDPRTMSEPIFASKTNLNPVEKIEHKPEVLVARTSSKETITLEYKPEVFTCFICGAPKLPFERETCIWYDHLSVPRKACTSCIECVTGIEELPRIDEEGIFI